MLSLPAWRLLFSTAREKSDGSPLVVVNVVTLARHVPSFKHLGCEDNTGACIVLLLVGRATVCVLEWRALSFRITSAGYGR